jgi:DNA-binding transcriptional regulator LsrR (DeoR family)
MDSNIEKRNQGNFTENAEARSLGAWIKYQLALQGLTQRAIAKEIGVSNNTVRTVIFQEKTSARVREAIAGKLGFRSWKELIHTAEYKGRVA